MAPVENTKTLFINNLPEHIDAEKWDGVFRALYEEKYGKIVNVVAKSSLRRRGQAFIAFENADAATRCLQETNGFPLCGKPMRIQFARMASDITVANERPQDLDTHKRARKAEKEKREVAQQQESKKRPAVESAPAVPRPIKQAKVVAPKSAVIPEEFLPANKTIFVRELPEEFTIEQISELFGQYKGFQEARLVPGRKGLAFVEYADVDGAIEARAGLNNVAMGVANKPLSVTYQRQ